MIVSDVNLLLYAYDSDSPFHGKTVAWWQRCLSGPEPIGLLDPASGKMSVGRDLA